MGSNGKNLIAKIAFGDLQVELTAEGASWNPDVADDLIKRMAVLWKQSLVSMAETNTWLAYDVEDVDDE